MRNVGSSLRIIWKLSGYYCYEEVLEEVSCVIMKSHNESMEAIMPRSGENTEEYSCTLQLINYGACHQEGIYPSWVQTQKKTRQILVASLQTS